jgi:triphosphoribosyl-dephospho-CoA synthase
MESASIEDAVSFYQAVRKARPGGLKTPSSSTVPDARSTTAKKEVLEKQIALYDVMKLCAKWDNICLEWVTGMRITFNDGYPTMMALLKEIGDMNIAIVHTFLTILARHPDTLIARRRGVKEAKIISGRAKAVLAEGGLLTQSGKKAIIKLDSELRTPNNSLNPGTTADLTASSIMVSIICGMRP